MGHVKLASLNPGIDLKKKKIRLLARLQNKREGDEPTHKKTFESLPFSSYFLRWAIVHLQDYVFQFKRYLELVLISFNARPLFHWEPKGSSQSVINVCVSLTSKVSPCTVET